MLGRNTLATLTLSAALALAGCSSGNTSTGSVPPEPDGGGDGPRDQAPTGPPTSKEPEEETPDAGAAPEYEPLPFSGGASAPVVASLTYRCSAYAVQVAIVVTDPDGLEDLSGLYYQRVGLFTSASGAGPAETHTFNVSSTGSYFGGSATGDFFVDDDAVRSAVCAADTWPATVTVTDKTGHSTIGKVRATRTL